MSETPILKADAISSGYGISRVLFDCSLEIPQKGSVAILGRNGAGKTTLLKTLVGELKLMSGNIWLDGNDCNGMPTEALVRAGMGYVPQEHSVFGSLSVRENLLLGAMANSKSNNIDLALDYFPKLGSRLSQQAGTLSGGERKMLAVGRAVLGQPRLLMLDEPTEGVWIGVIEEIADRLALLAKEISLIIVEQHVELALRVSNHAYVMDRGSMALHGTADEIRNHPELVRYLAP